jgi:hypothetical protein
LKACLNGLFTFFFVWAFSLAEVSDRFPGGV